MKSLVLAALVGMGLPDASRAADVRVEATLKEGVAATIDFWSNTTKGNGK